MKLRIVVSLILMLMSAQTFAQEVEMADAMRANGKIFVVVGIILIVLIGLIAYLLLLDRKISRLEREIKQEEGT
jgi:CcmD family protein